MILVSSMEGGVHIAEEFEVVTTTIEENEAE